MAPDDSVELENRMAMGRRFATSVHAEARDPHSGRTCPDCNGSLMSVSANNCRCRVGHAWTADALLKARDDEIENALWVGLRGLRERVTLPRRPANSRYTELADDAGHVVRVLGRRLAEATSSAGERGDR